MCDFDIRTSWALHGILSSDTVFTFSLSNLFDETKVLCGWSRTIKVTYLQSQCRCIFKKRVWIKSVKVYLICGSIFFKPAGFFRQTERADVIKLFLKEAWSKPAKVRLFRFWFVFSQTRRFPGSLTDGLWQEKSVALRNGKSNATTLLMQCCWWTEYRTTKSI